MALLVLLPAPARARIVPPSDRALFAIPSSSTCSAGACSGGGRRRSGRISAARASWAPERPPAPSIAASGAAAGAPAEVDRALPADVKATYAGASVLKSGRVVFNVRGNKSRLVARVNYPYRIVYIRFVGTHEEYDAINAETV